MRSRSRLRWSVAESIGSREGSGPRNGIESSTVPFLVAMVCRTKAVLIASRACALSFVVAFDEAVVLWGMAKYFARKASADQ